MELKKFRLNADLDSRQRLGNMPKQSHGIKKIQAERLLRLKVEFQQYAKVKPWN